MCCCCPLKNFNNMTSQTDTLSPSDLKKRQQVIETIRSRLRSKEQCHNLDFTQQLAGHNYSITAKSGTGTFGTVYQAKRDNDGNIVAIKRVSVSESEVRETDVHKLLRHVNVVSLYDSWEIPGTKGRSMLYVVMDFLPSSLEEHIEAFAEYTCTIPEIMIKVFTFQMFRGINYLHIERILHRDIKPSNLLVDFDTGMLKICDFGCAKLVKKKGRTNRTYVCSRYYRAPELVLRNSHNGNSIDVWAAACVLAECFRGAPIFPGKNADHQYGAIADVLGNPTPLDLAALHPTIREVHAKKREADGSFDQHFPPNTPIEGMNLLARIFLYDPNERLTSLAACAEPFYDSLRENFQKLKLPSGAPFPPIFDFSTDELLKAPADVLDHLFPGKPRDATGKSKSSKTTGVFQKFERIKAEVKKAQAAESPLTESTVTDSETQHLMDVFSEPDSSDVDEEDLWDCRKMQVL